MDNKKEFIDFIKKRAALYMNVFGTDDGKKLLDELKKQFFISRSTAPNHNDINEKTMIWNEAQRSLILEFINMSDKEFINEHIKRMEKE